MTDEPEPPEQELKTGYSNLEIILIVIVGSVVSGLLGFLIGIYIKM